ncbi:MAG: twin-arginine translocase TatA/TatE family subunit [Bacteroidales bacterium]
MGNFLLFFNISGGEILVIVLVVYLVFGPKKIPELARMLGKGINELRRATDDIRKEINREANKIKEEVNLDIDDPLDEINKRRKRQETQAEKEKKEAENPEKKGKEEPSKTVYTEPATDASIPREYMKNKKENAIDDSTDSEPAGKKAPENLS